MLPVASTEHQGKFSERITDSAKTAALRGMIPKDLIDRFLFGKEDEDLTRAKDDRVEPEDEVEECQVKCAVGQAQG